MHLKAIESLLARRPDASLFHYTGQSGLHGIVSSKVIWATHINYLNDEFEFNLAKKLALHILPTLSQKFTDDISMILIEEIRSSVDSAGTNVCIASFSENSDQLSQWRGYCKNSGYSIGFKYDFLKKITDRENWLIVPCIYNPDEQYELMKTILLEVLAKNKEEYATRTEDYILGGDMGYLINRTAAIFKDEAFTEEKEWRLISKPLSNKSRDFSFRIGNISLIPYYKLSLNSEEEPFDIEKLIVGPSTHQELAINAATQFLYSNGHENTDIKKSLVPYRDW